MISYHCDPLCIFFNIIQRCANNSTQTGVCFNINHRRMSHLASILIHSIRSIMLFERWERSLTSMKSGFIFIWPRFVASNVLKIKFIFKKSNRKPNRIKSKWVLNELFPLNCRVFGCGLMRRILTFLGQFCHNLWTVKCCSLIRSLTHAAIVFHWEYIHKIQSSSAFIDISKPQLKIWTFPTEQNERARQCLRFKLAEKW